MVDSDKIVELIEKQPWIEKTADSLQGTVSSSLESLGPASQPVKNFLSGVWLGHPLHPVLTDIPLGAWTVAGVLDVAEIFGVKEVSKGADNAVAIGLAGALGSAVTGLADWSSVDDAKPKKVGAVHALLNIAATILYVVSLALRKSNHRPLGRLFSGFGYILTGASAFLGGILVFSEKIGVTHAPSSDLPEDWVSVANESDLVEGQPILGKFRDVEVVLVKRGATIDALANVCSHLGGPLCDGKVDGNTVICPWHQSKFDLLTGAVIDGPATSPQPVFDTRVRNNKVEVRVQS